MAHTYNYLVRAYREDGSFLDMAIGIANPNDREGADAQARFCITQEFVRAHVCERKGDTAVFRVVAAFNKEGDEE